ncbi:MAG: AcvB/VirJ family lysyl-phosphatidylglycerol hydrolase [Pseudomonadota bacterium]
MNMQKVWMAVLLCVVATPGAAREPGGGAPDSLADLPLVEVRPAGATDRLAVFYSGDGGWAALDKGVSERLADAGVTVIGVNSLRYFWSGRKPDQAAHDLARLIDAYLLPEHGQLLLIGYSTGADVLPFLVNRLPVGLRARVTSIALIAPGHDTAFEIHVADWLPGSGTRGTPLLPEIERLGQPVLCLYGKGDTSALCPDLPAQRGTTQQIGAGHHLGEQYATISARILAFSSVITTAGAGR